MHASELAAGALQLDDQRRDAMLTIPPSGQIYAELAQVEDDEVIALLAQPPTRQEAMPS